MQVSILSQRLSDLGFLILDPVGLVNNQISPVEFLEHSLLDDEHLIGCDTHIPLSWQQHVSDQGSLRTKEKCLAFSFFNL